MKNKKKIWRTYLLNPFEFLAGTQALILGFGFLLLSLLIGTYFNARYDGVLNLHFVEDVSIIETLHDLLINFISLTLIFFLMAKVFGAKHTRLIDIAGTNLVATAPFSILPFANINNYLYETGQQLQENIGGNLLESSSFLWLIIISLFLISGIIWTTFLLFKAYQVSTNLKGRKLVVSFILAVFAAILLSKYLVISIPTKL